MFFKLSAKQDLTTLIVGVYNNLRLKTKTLLYLLLFITYKLNITLT